MSNKLLGRYGLGDYAKKLAIGEENDLKLERAFTPYDPPGQNVIFHRYVVIDVVPSVETLFNGNDEEFKKKREYWASLKVADLDFARVLPRNTIIGKRINDGNASSIENPIFLFPFFSSHLALPCKPGEHVWVMFETLRGQSLGYWFCKIAEISHVDDVNHTHPPRAFESSFFPGTKDKANNNAGPDYSFRLGRSIKTEDGTFTSIDSSMVNESDEKFYENLLIKSESSQIITYEAVPRFKKRPGDIALEGSNNTLIVLGTDRTGPYADTSQISPETGKILKKLLVDQDGNAGCIDIVAGRGQTPSTSGVVVEAKSIDGSPLIKELGKSELEVLPNEGDPDWVNDKSRVLVSQRTKVDANLKLTQINQGFEIKDQENGDAAVILKSDKLRVIGRKDVQILVKDDAGSDVTTIVAKSTGDITLKAKNTSIKIDNKGNITLDSEGDVTVNPKGVVKLGSASADKPCARETDKVDGTNDLIFWINNVLIPAVLSKVPAPGAVVPLTPPPNVIGVIAEGSDKVLVLK